jgi:hypothetical protein
MRIFFGGLLLAAGILIAGGSGICSLYVLFSPGGELGSGLSMLPLVLIFGGLPLAVGVAMAFGGRSVIRRAREAQPKP